MSIRFYHVAYAYDANAGATHGFGSAQIKADDTPVTWGKLRQWQAGTPVTSPRRASSSFSLGNQSGSIQSQKTENERRYTNGGGSLRRTIGEKPEFMRLSA